MKILIATGLYPPDIGGPATYSALLERELPRRGIGVEILAFGVVRKYPVVLRHIVYFFMVLWRARNVDIIYAQDPVSVGFPAAIAALILRKRFVLKVVGDYAWEQYELRRRGGAFAPPELFGERRYDMRTELRRIVEHMTARMADRVIVPSKYLERIVRKWGVRRTKISVVYNGFDAPSVSMSKGEARSTLNIDGTIIVSVGRLVPWKGFELLIEAMGELVTDNPDLRLYIIGSGPLDDALRTRVRTASLEHVVFFTGAISHERVLEYFCAADCFVLNTGYEGLSHTMLEAMAHALPIVTTDIGGNPELIADHESGILVPFNHRDLLIDAIRTIFKDSDMASQYASNGKARIRMFREELLLDRLIQIMTHVHEGTDVEQ